MKFINDYENRYSVDTEGRIWSHLSNKWLKPYITKFGYHAITLYKKGSTKRYRYFIHRLVALAFLPNYENKPEVNHINFITNDNRVENLEWVTGKENIHHTIKHGRHSDKGRIKKGNDRWKKQMHPLSRSVIEVNSGKIFYSARSAARNYGIPHQYVFNSIKNNMATKGLRFKRIEDKKIVTNINGALRKVTTAAYP